MVSPLSIEVDLSNSSQRTARELHMTRRYTPKDALIRITRITEAWETLRPAKSFSGMTLDQFKQAVKPMHDTRAQLAELDRRSQDVKKQREAADEAALNTAQLIINAVKGDPEETEDGALYAAMGFVRKGLRSTGLTRRRANGDAEMKTEGS